MIDRIQTQFGVAVDCQSLVSSLSKKVARQHRFPPREEHFLAPARSPMKLLAASLSIIEDRQRVFPQQRTIPARCD